MCPTSVSHSVKCLCPTSVSHSVKCLCVQPQCNKVWTVCVSKPSVTVWSVCVSNPSVSQCEVFVCPTSVSHSVKCLCVQPQCHLVWSVYVSNPSVTQCDVCVCPSPVSHSVKYVSVQPQCHTVWSVCLSNPMALLCAANRGGAKGTKGKRAESAKSPDGRASVSWTGLWYPSAVWGNRTEMGWCLVHASWYTHLWESALSASCSCNSLHTLIECEGWECCKREEVFVHVWTLLMII